MHSWFSNSKDWVDWQKSDRELNFQGKLSPDSNGILLLLSLSSKRYKCIAGIASNC